MLEQQQQESKQNHHLSDSSSEVYAASIIFGEREREVLNTADFESQLLAPVYLKSVNTAHDEN